MADLPTGESTYDFTGAAEEFEIPAAGTIIFKCWGAAGGGVFVPNGSSWPGGGAGGQVEFTLPVAAEDVVKIEVGGGGAPGTSPNGNGGLGGWPDGGDGGAYAPAAPTWGMAGGGGSTRVYLNDVLVAIAPGGGGGVDGGAGGGTSGGVDGRGFASAATQMQGGFPNTFGTWGVTPADIRGKSLEAGHGWYNGSGSTGNNTTPTEWSGSGGGGGYFGGTGGVGSGERNFASGGGGSAWYDPEEVDDAATNAGAAAVPYDDEVRPDGVAEGGAATGAPTAGGDGFAWAFYEPAGTPGDASGDIGTVTLTGIEGTATVGTFVEVDLPGLLVEARIEAHPESAASVILDLASELNAPESTPPEGGATGEGEAEDVVIGVLSVLPVEGHVVIPADAAGAIGEVTLTAPEGFAAQAIAEPALPSTTGTAPPQATAVGDANAEADFNSTVFFGPPEAVPSTPPMEVEVDLPGMWVEPIIGTGHAGDVVVAVGIMPEAALTQPPLASGHGDGEGVAQPNFPGDDPILVRITPTAPQASASGAAEANAFLALDVTMEPPVATTRRGIRLLAPIGTVFLRRPFGGAGENPNIEADAFGQPLTPILLEAPEAEVASGYTAEVDLGVVTLSPPLASVSVGGVVTVAMPGPIEITAPTGKASLAVLARGEIGVVDLIAPEAGVSAIATGEIPAITIKAVFAHGILWEVIGQGMVVRELTARAMVEPALEGQAIVEPVLAARARVRP